MSTDITPIITPSEAHKVWLFALNNDGTLSPASLSGGSGVPGGSPTQLQFNNTAFAGVPGSSVDPATGEITLTTVTGTALNIVQQDFASPVLSANDGTGDSVVFYVIGGTASFNVTDSSGDSINADASSGTATLDITDSAGGSAIITSAAGAPSLAMIDSSSRALSISPVSIGFFSATPAAKQTVTGVKLPSDTVMASLLAALVAYGLVTDSTT